VEAPMPEAPAQEELPEWLTEFVPQEPPVAEKPSPPVVEKPPPPVEQPREAPSGEPEAFGWTGFGEEKAEPTPVAEAAPPEEGFGWTGFGEEAAPLEETRVAGPPAVEAAAPKRTPPPAKAAPTEVPPPPPGVEKKPSPRPPLPKDLAKLQAYLRDNRRDYEVWLALARKLWQVDLYHESLEAYSRVLRSSKWLKEVVADMELHVGECPSDPVVRRVLGDAYMREGRLAEALDAYRMALDIL